MKTSIEWLQQKYDNCPESFLTEEDFEKAKEMHKQEIINAHKNGYLIGEYLISDKDAKKVAEQYYQETFKKD